MVKLHMYLFLAVVYMEPINTAHTQYIFLEVTPMGDTFPITLLIKITQCITFVCKI